MNCVQFRPVGTHPVAAEMQTLTLCQAAASEIKPEMLSIKRPKREHDILFGGIYQKSNMTAFCDALMPCTLTGTVSRILCTSVQPQ